ICLRDRPRSLGSSLMGKNVFVAMTTRSRDTAKSFNACPRTSSDRPSEYISAVSKKLIPRSSARRINGRLSSSSSTHFLHLVEPYVIVPRQSLETFKPVEPKLKYSMRLMTISNWSKLFLEVFNAQSKEPEEKGRSEQNQEASSDACERERGQAAAKAERNRQGHRRNIQIRDGPITSRRAEKSLK